MMENNDFLKKLLATFKIEAQEHVAALASGLIELEKAASAESRAAATEIVFREAHSLKGAARSVNITEIERLCQALEGVLAMLKRQEIPSSPKLFDLLHMAVDSLAQLLPSVGDGNAGPHSPRNAELIESLHHAAAGVGIQLPADREARDPKPGKKSGGRVPATARAPVARQTANNETGPPTELRPAPQETEPGNRAPVAAPETIRVPISKLTPLLQQSEELVFAKLAANQRTVDIRELNSTLPEWDKRWTRIHPEVRKQRQLSEGTGQPSGDKKVLRRSVGLLDFLDWNATYVQALENKLKGLAKSIELDHNALERMLNNLLESTKQVLIFPLSSLLDILPKLVRDLSRDQGKEVELVISGQDVEVDRRILEEMKDPLIHLVRNCIDHGIEQPEERKRKAKPPTGMIAVTTARKNSHVEITISDDGGGLDISQVRETCLKRGIVGRDELSKLNDQETLSLIFRSGVSTSPIITDISGRGLGLAIVREKVDKLGGEIVFESKLGGGTEFRISLPLTTATFRGVVASVNERLFLVPTANVECVVRVNTAKIQTVENRETIVIDGRVVALIRLAEILGVKRQSANITRPDTLPAVILAAGGKHIALLVDEILGEQEVLVKSLGHQLARVPKISGAAILGNGKVVPILNPVDLIRSAVSAGGSAQRPVRALLETAQGRRKAVLVVEDSITARTLLKNILETAAFDVTTAVDGVDALTQLRSGEFDLVVSDVQMPRMSGFELTAKIRAEKKLSELPVVLVTALDSREDRERGIDVGANAYIVKSSFDQSNLLEVIGRLV